ncbi:hypothetical protein D3C86_1445160 [compost metagenome]
MTAAPSFAYAVAISKPMPVPPPVIRAVRPWSVSLVNMQFSPCVDVSLPAIPQSVCQHAVSSRVGAAVPCDCLLRRIGSAENRTREVSLKVSFANTACFRRGQKSMPEDRFARPRTGNPRGMWIAVDVHRCNGTQRKRIQR